VTVLDLDDRLLDLLRRVARDLDLPIAALEHDLRDPIPSELRERFDVVVTDPMSNRESFELFLSRALSVLRPEGSLFAAVHGPASTVLAEVAETLRLPVAAWRARFNRYYSGGFTLHSYESDWVEFRPTADTRPAVAADEAHSPLDLYDEEFFKRPRVDLAFFDEITELSFAMPLFVGMLLDEVGKKLDLRIGRRIVFPGDDWTVVHAAVDAGHVTIHVDRVRRQITVATHPHMPGSARALRGLLASAYKSNAEGAIFRISESSWEVRIR